VSPGACGPTSGRGARWKKSDYPHHQRCAHRHLRVQEFANLFDRYLGTDWYLGSQRPDNIKRIDEIYNEEMWRAHELNRSRLVRTCREKLVQQYQRRNAPRKVLEAVEKPSTRTFSPSPSPADSPPTSAHSY